MTRQLILSCACVALTYTIFSRIRCSPDSSALAYTLERCRSIHDHVARCMVFVEFTKCKMDYVFTC